MKIFQINTVANSGSTGRITEGIGQEIINKGWESYIAYGRYANPSSSHLIKIGNKIDHYFHAFLTRLTDKHGLGSKYYTNKLIREIKKIDPDIIHLHNIHGYYINLQILFNYLRKSNKPVVWTLHDCWSFTGHCSYYEYVECSKWLTGCYSCPQKREYPKSILFDRSKQNYADKKRIFNSVENLTIVPVSKWLEGEVKKSFLKNHNIVTIQNGIDLEKFYPRENSDEIFERYNIGGKKIILGVASTWDKRKGLEYFFKVAEMLPENLQIILVGLSESQLKSLPPKIIGIKRTESIDQLAELYSVASVFVNPTLEDTYPTTNLEAIACGTPVITFKSGGSPESVNDATGVVVEKGNIAELLQEILKITDIGKERFYSPCRTYALENFDKKQKFQEYIDLYKKL
ncbi:MAG: glycosyltransferase [Cloacibacterium caeni]